MLLFQFVLSKSIFFLYFCIILANIFPIFLHYPCQNELKIIEFDIPDGLKRRASKFRTNPTKNHIFRPPGCRDWAQTLSRSKIIFFRPRWGTSFLIAAFLIAEGGCILLGTVFLLRGTWCRSHPLQTSPPPPPLVPVPGFLIFFSVRLSRRQFFSDTTFVQKHVFWSQKLDFFVKIIKSLVLRSNSLKSSVI